MAWLVIITIIGAAYGVGSMTWNDYPATRPWLIAAGVLAAAWYAISTERLYRKSRKTQEALKAAQKRRESGEL